MSWGNTSTHYRAEVSHGRGICVGSPAMPRERAAKWIFPRWHRCKPRWQKISGQRSQQNAPKKAYLNGDLDSIFHIPHSKPPKRPKDSFLYILVLWNISCSIQWDGCFMMFPCSTWTAFGEPKRANLDTAYPLVIWHSYGKSPFIVEFSIKNVIFHSCVSHYQCVVWTCTYLPMKIAKRLYLEVTQVASARLVDSGCGWKENAVSDIVFLFF